MKKKTQEKNSEKKSTLKATFDLISIGDPTIDTFLFVDDITVSKNKNGSLSATINWGDKLPVQKFFRTVAGNAANNAVGSSRLGLRTAFYTIVGDDTGGREIVHKMRKEKVASDYITLDKKHSTNASTVLSHDGERTIFVYHEHRKYKLPNLKPAKWVYLTSMGDGFEKIYRDLAAYLDRYSVKLGFNPGTFQLRKGVAANKILLQRTEVLSLNIEEAQSWVGENHRNPLLLCKALEKLGPRSILLTDGRAGCYSYSSEGFYFIPEFPGGQRIDATGAGDSCTTGYIAALANGLSHAESLRWGPVNAQSVVGHIGPIEGLLTRPQIEAQLKKNKTYQPELISQVKSEVAHEIEISKNHTTTVRKQRTNSQNSKEKKVFGSKNHFVKVQKKKRV